MIKLENAILKATVERLSTQLAFSKIKYSAYSIPAPPQHPAHDPESSNRELYLNYVEEVLNKKEG